MSEKVKNYPSLQGKKMPGYLPDMESPLNIQHEGDALAPDAVPVPDASIASGKSVPDPLGLVSPFGKGDK